MKASDPSASHELQLLTSPTVWLCALAAAFAMSSAQAANTPDDLSVPANAESMTPRQAYEHDKAYCHSDRVTEQRALCLKEASRAFQEARAGLLEPSADDHVASRQSRRHLARQRATGETTTSTSGTSSSSPDTNK